MKATYLIWALVCSALLALVATAHAGERGNVNRRTGLFEPPLSDLRKAAEREDRAELARTAGRLGPARLAKALADPDARTAQAALDALPLLPAGILLLDEALPLLGASDDATRAHAVRSVAALLASNDPIRLEEWEIAEETTRATCRALAAVAGTEGLPVTTRLLAVQGVTDAGNVCAASTKLTSLLSSPEPEIRRAAVLLADASAGSLLQTATNDGDSRVAAAAGARLCRSGLPSQTSAGPGHRPLRQLALAEGAAAEDVVEMLPCLAAAADSADARALDGLRITGSPTIRDGIRRLMKDVSVHYGIPR
jgi:hypothetical protein